MINIDDFINKKKQTRKHNTNWLQIVDHLYEILINGGSGSG